MKKYIIISSLLLFTIVLFPEIKEYRFIDINSGKIKAYKEIFYLKFDENIIKNKFHLFCEQHKLIENQKANWKLAGLHGTSIIGSEVFYSPIYGEVVADLYCFQTGIEIRVNLTINKKVKLYKQVLSNLSIMQPKEFSEYLNEILK